MVGLDSGTLAEAALEGRVDAYIVATLAGFSPLGADLHFLSRDLGVPEDEIHQLAGGNHSTNAAVTLVAIRSRRSGSCLRGVILAPCETSSCYARFATPIYGRPYRDFYYNVTYEAIAYAAEKWGARSPAVSHLSASGNFREEIAICNAEALAHYCDAHPHAIGSFTFLGCCISQEHLHGIRRLNEEGYTGVHWPISTKVEDHGTHELVHLEWNRSA